MRRETAVKPGTVENQNRESEYNVTAERQGHSEDHRADQKSECGCYRTVE